MEFYNSNIQLDKNVINDIFKIMKPEYKVLIFGLGYDSKMWYNLNKNTYFVENNQKYIDLNKNDISENNIIYYDYQDISVLKSFNLNDNDLKKYEISEKLLKLAPFDIILIDGPEGYSNDKPGRLLPIFWSFKYLSQKGSIIYIDDVKRYLENYCVNKYFKFNEKEYFTNRLGCLKIKI